MTDNFEPNETTVLNSIAAALSSPQKYEHDRTVVLNNILKSLDPSQPFEPNRIAVLNKIWRALEEPTPPEPKLLWEAPLTVPPWEGNDYGGPAPVVHANGITGVDQAEIAVDTKDWPARVELRLGIWNDADTAWSPVLGRRLSNKAQTNDLTPWGPMGVNLLPKLKANEVTRYTIEFDKHRDEDDTVALMISMIPTTAVITDLSIWPVA